MLSLGSASGAPGSTVILDLTFDTGPSIVAGLQWTLNYSPADIAAIHVAAGPAAASSGQTLTCFSRVGAVECLLVSPTGRTISSGVVAVVTLQFSLATRDGASAITLSDVLGASKDGTPLSIQTHGAVLPITGSALRFRPMTPCRVADTRNGNPFGGPAFPGNTHRDFVIPNSACAIPSTAAAYSLNISVLPDRETWLPDGLAHRPAATVGCHAELFGRPHEVQCRHRRSGRARGGQRLCKRYDRCAHRYQRLLRARSRYRRAAVLSAGAVPHCGYAQSGRSAGRAWPGSGSRPRFPGSPKRVRSSSGCASVLLEPGCRAEGSIGTSHRMGGGATATSGGDTERADGRHHGECSHRGCRQQRGRGGGCQRRYRIW